MVGLPVSQVLKTWDGDRGTRRPTSPSHQRYLGRPFGTFLKMQAAAMSVKPSAAKNPHKSRTLGAPRRWTARRVSSPRSFRFIGSKTRTNSLGNLTPNEFVTIMNNSMALAAEFRWSTLVALVLILASFCVRSDGSTVVRHSFRGSASD